MTGQDADSNAEGFGHGPVRQAPWTTDDGRRTYDGDSPESLAEFQRRGPVAGPVVLRQGPGDRDGGQGQRGRGARCAGRRSTGCGCGSGARSCWPRAAARISARRGSRASTSGRPCCWPIRGACCNRRRSSRCGWWWRALRRPPTGLPDVRDPSGMGQQPPYPLGSDLGMVGLGSPRPSGGGPGAGGRGPSPKQRPKDRGVRGEPPGDAGGWSRRDRGSRRPDDRPCQGQVGRPGIRDRRAGRGFRPWGGRPRPSTATPSGCWSTSWTSPPPMAQNQVVIDLARRQRRPTGEWGPLRPWWYSPEGRPRQV